MADQRHSSPPSKYAPIFAEIARNMRRQKLSAQIIAASLGVSLRTTFRWRQENKEFRRAIKVRNKDTQAYVTRRG
jgi:hypothetical protein